MQFLKHITHNKGEYVCEIIHFFHKKNQQLTNHKNVACFLNTYTACTNYIQFLFILLCRKQSQQKNQRSKYQQS